MDPYDFGIDEAAYRRADRRWLQELDGLAVHAGPPQQRMGTRAVAEADWLVGDEHRDRELALRRRLLVEAHAEVVGHAGGDEGAAATEAAALVVDWLRTYRPAWLPPGVEPGPRLEDAAALVQDDLCVMEHDAEGWRLTAGVVCFPTYWRLADKLGRVQQAVHGPVPHYATELAARVDRFFDRLVPGRVVRLRNWGFSAHPLLFAPDLAALRPPPAVDLDQLWFRSERQTLRRLPGTGAVLFTIRVQLAPAAAVAEVPGLPAALHAAMAAWTPELVASRGGRHGWVPHVSAWLGELARLPPAGGTGGQGA